ncbi:efflux RND transporter periplasmic adaptor subunit [Colwellia psychrerythraea]|uniref:Efflux transporter, RND family, MFP subunit subfamily n=1 Tax=Colwellia psychrerythraea (strain 34H / ATCC BAA-681) TaxID=167879 RepID=Q47YD9_COLP3|nr:HlyD family efflux transporter periplasmic adaptor subunit [Colwellia psychrerythraea]AAZ26956.1 efflux transporter, RND family, MFP subunit subfamily [Colwellia psychrerythraea 34H]
MDKPISNKIKKTNYRNYLLFTLTICIAAAVLTIAKSSIDTGKTYNVEKQNLVLDTVKQSTFTEFLPLRGLVQPEETIFIDTIDGGRVEEVFVQEGALVKQGQAILKLSNTNLQLNVLAREAEVSEQINNMRNTRLALEQNQLSLKRDVIELDFSVLRLQKDFNRHKALIEKKIISQQAFERVEDELAFQIKYRETVKESQEKEAILQSQQLAQLEQSIQTLQSNLAISRSSLDKLIIRAPKAGQLTFLDARVGESKRDGERLGQVDLIDQYKVSAQVDEFYVSRVAKGQIASFESGQKSYQLIVSKVYPGINNGTFKVDFKLQSQQIAQTLRLGQSLQMKFNLSSSESKLLLANGGFIQSSAGSWAFVVDPSGATASKRTIRLGRKNPQSIEVISGLLAGDRVITSSYASFADAQQLNLSN